MTDELVIMFPDHGGEGSLGKFGHQLVERYGESEAVHLVPVINGVSDADELRRITGGFHPRLEPALANFSQGVVNALIAGYGYVLERYPHATIVRLDTNEHPVELIPTLVQRVHEFYGLAIANLQFLDPRLTPGSPDEVFHAVCPTLYAVATHRSLALSGAHGMQAFAPDVCPQVLEAAVAIVEHANRDGGPPLRWGLCGAMAMGAVAIGVPVDLVQTEARQPRQRPVEKVAEQLNDFIRTVIAAVQLYDFGEP